jgi:hypothetical protein
MAANPSENTAPDPETQATPAGKVDELEEEIVEQDATTDPDDTAEGHAQEVAHRAD